MLELATWIATPMATALLAELGARVIKIEPLEGDPMRRYGPTGMKCVQGKESIALDLKTAEGRDIVHRLASTGRRPGATTTGRAFPSGSASTTRRCGRGTPG